MARKFSEVYNPLAATRSPRAALGSLVSSDEGQAAALTDFDRLIEEAHLSLARFGDVAQEGIFAAVTQAQRSYRKAFAQLGEGIQDYLIKPISFTKAGRESLDRINREICDIAINSSGIDSLNKASLASSMQYWAANITTKANNETQSLLDDEDLASLGTSEYSLVSGIDFASRSSLALSYDKGRWVVGDSYADALASALSGLLEAHSTFTEGAKISAEKVKEWIEEFMNVELQGLDKAKLNQCEKFWSHSKQAGHEVRAAVKHIAEVAYGALSTAVVGLYAGVKILSLCIKAIAYDLYKESKKGRGGDIALTSWEAVKDTLGRKVDKVRSDLSAHAKTSYYEPKEAAKGYFSEDTYGKGVKIRQDKRQAVKTDVVKKMAIGAMQRGIKAAISDKKQRLKASRSR